MANFYNATIRNANMTSIVTEAGANAQIKLYNGTRPASGGAVSSQTLIAELVAGATLGAVSGGVLTMNAISSDSSANATGTPTWVRVLKSDGATLVGDFDLTGFPACSATFAVGITSWTITAGNAA
jgi:hypothetical protein